MRGTRRSASAAEQSVSSFWHVSDEQRLNESLRSLMASTILVPKVELSGTTRNGTIVTAAMNFTYLNRFSDNPRVPEMTPEEIKEVTDLLGLSNTLAVFPVGLIITSIWAVLVVATMGYGTGQKIKCRNTYRRRIKRSLSNRPTKAYIETRSGIEFEEVMHNR